MTVDSILWAAAHILRTEGPERATTGRIAAKAGVSVGSLYQYFPNRAAILAVLRRRHGAFFEERVREATAPPHGAALREATARAVSQIVEIHALDGELHGALARDHAALDAVTEKELIDRVRAFLESRPSGVREPPDAELTAFVAVRAMTAMIHGIAVDAPERLRNPHYAAELTELFVRYLSA